jgi:hypothetical protein
MARTSVIVLQSIAMALVALALVASAWWLATSSVGAAPGTVASAIVVVPIAAAMLVLGWMGLRRWRAGGPPMRLYVFDALPVVVLIATAGPGAFRDPLGIAIAVAFLLPGFATFVATSP